MASSCDDQTADNCAPNLHQTAEKDVSQPAGSKEAANYCASDPLLAGSNQSDEKSDSHTAQPKSDVEDLWSDVDEEELLNLDYESNLKCSQSSSVNTDMLECDRIMLADGPPHEQFRPKYLIISDFAKQHWCEFQLLYSFAPQLALMRALPGEEVTLEESSEAKVVKGKGSDIHQERELEIQVPVEVTVETREDAWAVKLINLQQAVLAFSRGQRLAREVPVFGAPFDCRLFVYGIIDELRYDPDKHEVELSELKTRRSRNPPRRGQQEKDKYQVNLYAQLFNELVQGKVPEEQVSNSLDLKLDTPLGDDVMAHVKDVGSCQTETCTFGELLRMVLSQAQSLCTISKSRIEYVHQDSREEILVLPVTFELDTLRDTFLEHCRWWRGVRSSRGVDVEECWKCEHCQFAPLCEWRDHMAGKMEKKRVKK